MTLVYKCIKLLVFIVRIDATLKIASEMGSFSLKWLPDPFGNCELEIENSTMRLSCD